MLRTILICIAVAAAACLIGCTNEPAHNDAWLSFPYGLPCGSFNNNVSNCLGIQDFDEAQKYYAAMGIDPNNYSLSMWLQANGFPPPPAGATTYYYPHTDAHAIYANLGDLRIGRDMNCVQSGQRIACYVSNYGPPFNGDWPNVDESLGAAVNGPTTPNSCLGGFCFFPGGNPFATVAMIYDPSQGGPNNVTFFAFDAFGVLRTAVNLDQEGTPLGKTVPRMCMACHGGTYDTNTHTATGSQFLPFDVYFFGFSSDSGFTLEDQQEGLRKLNGLVAATNANQPILDFINGMYPNGVGNTGSEAVEGYLPAGWSDNPTLYTGVVRQYCRMCHLAQTQALAFAAYSDFQNAAGLSEDMVCNKHDMPHAQVPFGHDRFGFWHDPVAQRDLGNFFKNQGVNSCLPSD